MFPTVTRAILCVCIHTPAPPHCHRGQCRRQRARRRRRRRRDIHRRRHDAMRGETQRDGESVAASADPTQARKASFGEKAREDLKTLSRRPSRSLSSTSCSVSSARTSIGSQWGQTLSDDELCSWARAVAAAAAGPSQSPCRSCCCCCCCSRPATRPARRLTGSRPIGWRCSPRWEADETGRLVRRLRAHGRAGLLPEARLARRGGVRGGRHGLLAWARCGHGHDGGAQFPPSDHVLHGSWRWGWPAPHSPPSVCTPAQPSARVLHGRLLRHPHDRRDRRGGDGRAGGGGPAPLPCGGRREHHPLPRTR